MELGKGVQQIKVERGISFLDARKAVLSEQSANTSSKRTAEPAKLEMLQHLQLVKAVRGTLTPDHPLLNLQRKMLYLE